jgi:hypothetical protein
LTASTSSGVTVRPVGLHGMGARLLENVLQRFAAGHELTGRARDVGTSENLLHLDLLHGVSSSRPPAAPSIA